MAPSPRRYSPLFWVAVGLAVCVAAVCLCIGALATIIAPPPPAPTIAAARPPTPTPPPAPTMTPTNAAPPTRPAATRAPAAPAAPAASATPASLGDRYLGIARAGMTIPLVRSGGVWSASVLDAGDVSIRMPIEVGLSNEQTVRQGRRMMAQVVYALFTQVDAMERVNVIGTLPDGANGDELPALSIVVERAAFTAWDGTAANLPGWNVSPRLK